MRSAQLHLVWARPKSLSILASIGGTAALVMLLACLPNNGQSAFAQGSTGAKDSSASRPSVSISMPSFCSTVAAGTFQVEGTAAGNQSGVKKVEAFVGRPNSNDSFPFQPATPKSPGDWSTWSVNLTVIEPGPHRILVQVTDNSGVQNWAEETLNVLPGDQSAQSSSTSHRVAFVEPYFTRAAYDDNGFYSFYYKYKNTQVGTKITQDLNYLTAPISDLIDRSYFMPILNSIQATLPNVQVVLINDANVNDGYIFNLDGTNRFDTLFLLHEEYVTQKSYDNYKRFVEDGGKIVFLDSNVFFAQVSYDSHNCTVTLMRGHDWTYDGKSAQRDVTERYFADNREWVGSNTVVNDISSPVKFSKNPFNYTHLEENYVNNQDAMILLNYGAQFVYNHTKSSQDKPLAFDSSFFSSLASHSATIEGKNIFVPSGILSTPDQTNQNAKDATVAAYQMDYKQGKVIVLGLYAQTLENNTTFLNYLDGVILPRAIGGTNQIATSTGKFEIYSGMSTGKVSNIAENNQSGSVELFLDRTLQANDILSVAIPNKLVAALGGAESHLVVSVDGKQTRFNETTDDVEHGLIIPISSNASKVEINAGSTQVTPEYPFSALIAFGFATIVVTVSIRIRMRPGS